MNPLLAGAIVFLALAAFTATMRWRLLSMKVLKPDARPRLDRIGERVKALMMFGFGQRRMVDKEEFAPGFMHVLIFASFLAVQVRSLMLITMAFSSTAL